MDARHHVTHVVLVRFRGYTLLSVVSTAADSMSGYAAGNPPALAANIVPGNPPLYVNNFTRHNLTDANYTTVSTFQSTQLSISCLS